MIRTIDGRKYLMRDQRPTKELRKLYEAFCEKYRSSLSFYQWLGERGKVYVEIKPTNYQTGE